LNVKKNIIIFINIKNRRKLLKTKLFVLILNIIIVKKIFEKNIIADLKCLVGRTPSRTADTWRLGWKAWELGKQRVLTPAPSCCYLALVLAEDLACRHKRKSTVGIFFFYNLPMPMSLGWIAYTVAIWSRTSRTQHPPKMLSLAIQPYLRILSMAV
jgi:hypothetical protein